MSKQLPPEVPAHAMLLLDFIYRTDAGRPRPQCYEVIYGNNQNKLSKPITSMTLGDLIDAQADWSKRYGSSAAGAAQFMRATLIGIANEIPSLSGALLFEPDLQDRLGYYLLLRRGYADFTAGNLGLVEFGKALAQEWASFPVLADCKGSTRQLKRGQSYYAGDGLNKALVKPEVVEALLQQVFLAARPEPAAVAQLEPSEPAGAPAPAPMPAPATATTSSVWSLLFTKLAMLLTRRSA